MSKGQSTEISTWIANPDQSPTDMELCRTLATKCSKLASILDNGSTKDISRFLAEMPANDETFELVARFCNGYNLSMSSENVVPISCLAHHLGMTETHCRNNLFRESLFFLERNVLPSWNETVKAFRSSENVLHQALQIGIVGACVESLVEKALSDPNLLGQPEKRACFEEESDEIFRPQTKRRLFFLSWNSEDLTTLSLRLYEPLMREMISRGVSPAHVAESICSYAKKWALWGRGDGDRASIFKRNSQREILEAVERLLPRETGLVGSHILFEMLRSASVFEVSLECRDGFELRIGRDLHRATVKDLLILSEGREREAQYDIECVRRLLKHFYGNYTSAEITALIRVAELVEEFLSEIASDADLKKETFAALAEISMDVSRGTQRSSDGIYKGIDIYLDKHRHLTESEREEVCRVLDLNSLSAEAADHAAKNERLPVRVVLQVLFLAQLQIRGSIAREVQSSQDDGGQGEDENEEEEEEVRLLGGTAEMEKMSRKLAELQRECGEMKKEMEIERPVVKKEKVSLWKEMKRKFGCFSESVSNCNNCQVKRRRKKIMSLK